MSILRLVVLTEEDDYSSFETSPPWEAFSHSISSLSLPTPPLVFPSAFLISGSIQTGPAYVCVCVCAWRWRILDHQLISHAGRHQRRLELTLRVGGCLAPAISHGRPLQRRQTYTAPIHIEMNRWSCATCRRAPGRR